MTPHFLALAVQSDCNCVCEPIEDGIPPLGFCSAEKKERNKMTEGKEVSFVTKKVLVTFTHPVCFMAGETAIFSNAAVCEYQQEVGREGRDELPHKNFTVLALPDGRLLAKAMKLSTGWQTIGAILEL